MFFALSNGIHFQSTKCLHMKKWVQKQKIDEQRRLKHKSRNWNSCQISLGKIFNWPNINLHVHVIDCLTTIPLFDSPYGSHRILQTNILMQSFDNNFPKSFYKIAIKYFGISDISHIPSVLCLLREKHNIIFVNLSNLQCSEETLFSRKVSLQAGRI